MKGTEDSVCEKEKILILLLFISLVKHQLTYVVKEIIFSLLCARKSDFFLKGMLTYCFAQQNPVPLVLPIKLRIAEESKHLPRDQAHVSS